MNLSPEQALILSKFLDEKTAKEFKAQLSPGSYEDSFTVEVTGKITIGEDFPAQNVMPWKKIALALLSNLSVKEAVSVVKEILESEEDTTKLENKLKLTVSPLLGTYKKSGVTTGMAVVNLKK